MSTGGARARSGPAPDPNALRRDRKSDAAGWSTLPAEGFTGAVPDWPLEGCTEREFFLWAEFWRKPQAVLWDRNRQVFEVAMHVRCFAEAELPGAATPLRTLVRQQADALLLTMPAMLAARIRVSGDELREKRSTVTAEAAPSSRTRLRAVQSGDGA